MAGHLTLALIKPHAYMSRCAGEIISRIEKEGFAILLAKVTQLQPEGAQEFYAEHKGKPFFANLTQVMGSGPIWALTICKDNAVDSWREVIGATNPAEAAEGTLRKQFGNPNNITNNAVHGSSSDSDAKREINFFFGREMKLVQRINEISNQRK